MFLSNPDRYTVEQLRQFCRDNDFHGFSKYRREDLIRFIEEKLTERDYYTGTQIPVELFNSQDILSPRVLFRREGNKVTKVSSKNSFEVPENVKVSIDPFLKVSPENLSFPDKTISRNPREFPGSALADPVEDKALAEVPKEVLVPLDVSELTLDDSKPKLFPFIKRDYYTEFITPGFH